MISILTFEKKNDKMNKKKVSNIYLFTYLIFVGVTRKRLNQK